MLIGVFAEIFDLADQVSHAELKEGSTLAGVFAIGAVAVTAEDAFELCSQQINQNLRAAVCNLENHESRGVLAAARKRMKTGS